MKRFIISVIAFCLLFVTFGFAQDNINIINNATYGVDVRSQYLGVIGSVCYDEPVAQHDLFVSFAHNIYAELWVSHNFDGGQNGGQEVDYFCGWDNNRFNIGMAYVDLNKLWRSGDDMLYPYVKWTQKMDAGISVYAEVDGVIDLNVSNNTGMLGQIGANFSTLESKKFGIVGNAHLLYDDGVFQGKEGLISFFSAGIEYHLTKKTTVRIVNVKFISPLAAAEDRETEHSLSSGLSIGF